MAIVLGLPTRPYWIELPHEVRVKVTPLDTSRYEQARFHGQTRARELLDEQADLESAGAEVTGLPNGEDAAEMFGMSQMLFAQELARSAILQWEGVYLPGEEQAPAPVNETTVGDLMRFHDIADTFLVKYAAPVKAMVLEGNASGPAPSGTSATGPDIADVAETNDSPAPKADAD